MNKIIFFVFFFFYFSILNAQNVGDVDLAFPVNIGFNTDDSVNCTLPLPDGKILVGGVFNGTNNQIICLVRLNSDGTFDSSFSLLVLSGTGNTSIKCIKLQNDGKIIVGGSFNLVNGVTQNKIVRLNSDGTRDASFNVGIGFSDDNWQNTGTVEEVSIQSDGKIIVGGSFFKYNNVSQNKLIRLNPDGTKDGTFNIGNGFSNTLGYSGSNAASVQSISVQSDGKIIVGGSFDQYDGSSQKGLIRLNPNGTKDTSFNIGSGFSATYAPEINRILTQSNGKILIGGYWESFNSQISYGIIRLNSDGTKDTSFNVGGNGLDSAVQDIAIDNLGKIIVVGPFNYYNNTIIPNNLIRLNSNGTIDNTFNIGSSFNDLTSTISILSDGKILVGGEFVNFNGYKQNKLIKLNNNGTVDSSFLKMWNDANFGVDSYIYDIALQSDGKILAGGKFSKFNDVDQKGLIRLNLNGTKDTTFNLGTGFSITQFNQVYAGEINKIVIQPDNKILVCGQFTSFNGITMPNSQSGAINLVRLNTNGSLDTNFILPVISYPEIALQSDGKIIGINGNSIVRFNSNGTIDNSFIATFNDASKLLVQPDGKILVGKISSGSSTDLIRLNSNGTIDISFITGSASAGGVQSLTYLSDGKILVGGKFLSFNSIPNVGGLVRLNNNGTVDTSFNASSIAPRGFVRVQSVFVQSDGKLLVGGDGGSEGGRFFWSSISRLNPNGGVDSVNFANINIDNYYDGTVNKILQQNDGKILIAGLFNKYGSTESIGLIRLKGVSSIPTPIPSGNTSQTLCAGTTILDLLVTGTEIKWYSVATGGTALASTTTLVNGTTYYGSQTVNGLESTSRLAVTVNITNTAAPTGNTTQTLATGSTLSNIIVTGTAIQWYTTATGGTPLTNTTPLVNGGVYYASQTVNSCESPSRLMITVTITPFTLPYNNFTIETKSETCATKNNGEIIINAVQTYNYTATINGTNYNFVNNGLTVTNLAPGVYTICIGVTGKTFQQCYSVTIGKGGSITGKSSISSNKALVDITSGTAPFEILVNGTTQFETSETNFAVDVKQGDLLEVKTAIACEGIYVANVLDGLVGVVIHPNPTAGLFEITIPTSKTEVEVELYSIGSQLISKRKYPVINQRIQLSLEKETDGVYFAKVNLDVPVSLTIIKKL